MFTSPPTSRRTAVVHHLICLGTLLAFVTTSTGIPWFAESNSSCQCDKTLKAAGQCCCFQAKNGRSVASCCTQKPALAKSCCSQSAKSCCTPATKSCCAGRPPASHDDSPGSQFQIIAYCGCGGPDETGLLINAEPRILAPVALAPLNANGTRWFPPRTLPLPNRSILPETPPPEMCSLFFSLA